MARGKTVEVALPPKLIPLFTAPARYRVCYGGRGSGKSRSFAKMTAIRAYMWAMEGRSGVILCARQFMNSLADSSLQEVKAAIESEPWLAEFFEIGEKFIRTRDGRVSYLFAGLDRNIASVKSTARILLCWVDEAEPVTESAWQVLIPTVREEDSELWITYNPESETSATHKRFREHPADDALVVELNYLDNPWFPLVLEKARNEDLGRRPDQYAHIWEGDFKTIYEGAYYAASIALARSQGRVTPLSVDPLMDIWTFWDIGTRDHTAIWVCQFIGTRVHCIDYYEAAGQPLATHLAWLRDNGYDKAYCILPHDGANVNHLSAERFVDHIRSAGFRAEVIRNQGKGAAMARVEALRRLFPSMWIDPEHCAGGLKALAGYHEKMDEQRGIGLGPEHDKFSHGADAGGLIAIAKPLLFDPVLNSDRDDVQRRPSRQSTGY